MEENIAFFGPALQIVDEVMKDVCGVSFETHRGRTLFNPFTAVALIKKFPNLRLTADLSHWVLVCERLFTNPEERAWLEKVVHHVDHTHARVGYSQHAQIPHTSYKGFDNELKWFDEWWQKIWEQHRLDGQHITLTPEIGPVPYTQTKPDGSPIVDAWDFSNTEKDRILNNYNKWVASLK